MFLLIPRREFEGQMPCGCIDTCNCCIDDSETIAPTGSGVPGDCYALTVIADPEGGLTTGAAGVAILIDPASTAPVSLSGAGLLIDCCPSFTAVADSDTIDFSILGGDTITGDVIPDPDGGLENTANGVAIEVDPASTADVSTSAAGLRVDVDPASVLAAAWDPGDLKPTTRLAATAGWLMCDGSLQLIASYPALFAEIGHDYNGGVDPGGGQFRLPDGQGRTVYGIGANGNVNSRQDNDGLANGLRTPVHLHAPGALVANAAATGVTVNAGGGLTGDENSIQTGVGGGATQAVWDDVASTSGNPGAINAISVAAGAAAPVAAPPGSGPGDHHQHDFTHGHGVTDPTHGHGIGGTTAATPVPYFVGNWMIKT